MSLQTGLQVLLKCCCKVEPLKMDSTKVTCQLKESISKSQYSVVDVCVDVNTNSLVIQTAQGDVIKWPTNHHYPVAATAKMSRA